MRISGFLAAGAVVALLAGCAATPQAPVPFAAQSIASGSGRIGVAMAEVPKVDTHLPGAACLLCMAVAATANSALTTHTRTLPVEDLPNLKNELADLLRKKGATVIVVPDALQIDALPRSNTSGTNIAARDFSGLKQKYQIDKLVVIHITTLGMLRNYSGYVPTSDPFGVFQGSAYLVNLANNTYEWYEPVDVKRIADGKWDEPPKFPGLTNAYFQSLELGKDIILKSFR